MLEIAPKEAEVKVPLSSLCTLMINALQGFAEEDVGFEDTSVTVTEFLRELERRTRIRVSVRDLEQLLWAANLRASSGRFFSPKPDETFDDFSKQLFHYLRIDRQQLLFDKVFNVITIKPGGAPEENEAK